MNTNFTGICLGFAGYIIFVLLDSIIKKYLVQDYPVLEINFFICLFSLIPISFALHFISGWKVLINNKVHIQLLRDHLFQRVNFSLIYGIQNHLKCGIGIHLEKKLKKMELEIH